MNGRAGWVSKARASTLLLAVLLVACSESNWTWWKRKDRELPPEPKPQQLTERDAVRADSIGDLALVSGSAAMQIKGFGLVVGLNGNGSRDCATSIRTYLIDRMQKLMASDAWSRSAPQLSVPELIDSPDTAVVELTAFVPLGAPRGMRLDVRVVAATGTQTRSLEGGLLLPSELKVFGPASSGRGILAGRTIGYARGPVFTSPFVDGAYATTSADPRRGLVLGGAIMTERRPARLILKQPSYPIARRIQQRLNETFGHAKPPTAEAMSQAYVVLRTPSMFRARPGQALQLAAHTYLSSSPAFLDGKLRDLAEAAVKPGTDYQALSMAWWGIGRRAVSHARAFYTSEDPALSFWAARAGVELGDVKAIAVMGSIARSRRHEFRLYATQALGESGGQLRRAAASELLPLLDDADVEVRIAAYESLLRLRHPVVESHSLGHKLDPHQVNVTLDILDCGGEPLIYARRSRAPRIAIFGQDIPVQVPLFYKDATGEIMLNADAGAGRITMLAQIVPGGRFERFTFEPNVIDLIARLASRPVKDEDVKLVGMGLSYSRVLQVLVDLTESGVVSAKLDFERTSLRELLGPTQVGGRREADEPTLDEFAPDEDEPPLDEFELDEADADLPVDSDDLWKQEIE